MPTPTPIPPPSPSEPVMTAAWIQTAILSTATAVLAVLGAFGKWTPTSEQWTAIMVAVGTVVAIVFPLVGWFVRSKVTPVSSLPAPADVQVDSPVAVSTPVRLVSPDAPTPWFPDMEPVDPVVDTGGPPAGMFPPE